MDTLKKIANVLAQNLGYTVVLVAAIILFAVFSGGVLPGIITAGSALIGYACINILYKQFKATSAPKSAKKKK